MEQIAADVRTKSRGEMTVVTLRDIGTRDVQEIALQIGRQWKVGKIGNPGDPTRNAGAVILLVPKETSSDGRGHCFIATGRGAEGFITDADAGDICREATPAFMARDYSSGLELVTLRTAERFAKEFNFQLDTSFVPPAPASQPDVSYPSSGGGGIPPFVYLILFFVVLSILSGGRRGRRGCGGPGCLPIIIPMGGFGRGGFGRGGLAVVDLAEADGVEGEVEEAAASVDLGEAAALVAVEGGRVGKRNRRTFKVGIMMKLEELVRQLQLAYGEGLRSVVLFGSAVAGEHNPKKSDYNVLVIVDSLPLARLRAVAAVSKAWAEDGNPPPMTFTTNEWKSSSDIFPMEYADILERHRVLYGDAPFDGIQVAPSDLRLQVEQQTMGKLLQLRQATMGAGGDSKLQLEVLEKSLSTLMVIFRGVSRLVGEVPSQDYEELTQTLARRAGFSADPFVRVIRHVRGTDKIARESAAGILEGYLAAMERLVAFLNEYRR